MKKSYLSRKNESGQGLVEYSLILVLVAIVVIAALMVLGPIIGDTFSSINSSLNSVDSSAGAAPASACVVQTVSNISSTECSALSAANQCADYDYVMYMFGGTECTTHD